MSGWRVVWVATLVVFGQACGGSSRPMPAAGVAPTMEEACSPYRWVGRATGGGGCPRVAPDWQGGALFVGAPAPDETFCQYTWTGNGAPILATRPSENGRGPDEWLDRDCHVVARLADPALARRKLARDLYAAFMWRAGQLPTLPELPGTVQVAVLDTFALGAGEKIADVQPEHGSALVHLISALAHPGRRVDHRAVPSYRALALYAVGPSGRPSFVTAGEGHFGFQSTLAQTVHAAVRDWQAGRMRDDGLRLVINISAGWSGRYNGTPGNPDEYSEPVRAVLAALRLARCEGALVVAAAGNETDGPEWDAGALYPAAWEVLPVVADGGSCPDPSRERGNAPLVYAVGGLDPQNRPIANGRPEAMPRIAAAAFEAIADLSGDAFTRSDARPSRLLTGTSVSTAVVAAAAALAWRAAPDQRPSDIMQTVRAAGRPLPGPPPVFLTDVPAARATSAWCDPTCEDEALRRVSICDVVHRVTDGAQPCPDTPEPVVPFANEIANVLDRTHDRTGWHTQSQTAIPGCDEGDVLWFGAAGPPEAPCPETRFYSAVMAPWAQRPTIDPQPEINGCDICRLERTTVPGLWRLTVGVTKDVFEMRNPVLKLSDGRSFDLGVKSLAAGTTTLFDKLSLGDGFTSAKLVHVVVTATTAYSSSAVVYPYSTTSP